MAEKGKRLDVRLTPLQHKLVAEISDETCQPMAEIVRRSVSFYLEHKDDGVMIGASTIADLERQCNEIATLVAGVKATAILEGNQ